MAKRTISKEKPKARPAAPKRGRPSAFRPEYVRMAAMACERMGATDEDLAAVFGVAVATIGNWKTDHPEFLEAIKRAKSVSDDFVERRLFERATGYEHRAVKIFYNSEMDSHHVVPFLQRYAPDTLACIFWLKNRRPDLWRDKHEVEGKLGLEQILAASYQPEAGASSGDTGTLAAATRARVD